MSADATAPRIDSVELFAALAGAMNAEPARYETLGWCDLDLGLVIRRADGDPFRILLRFRDYRCDAVLDFAPGSEDAADCYLEGDLAAWQEMLDDILAHGRATGLHTLSSLVLLGERVRVKGRDPMGVDRFFRYNQTLQSFFDAAAELARPVAA